MSALLKMEPRVAGTDVMEPVVDFEQRWESQVDQDRCPVTRPGVSKIC
ncbi:hypothetical protein [Nonomuraea sp. NPDC050691]